MLISAACLVILEESWQSSPKISGHGSSAKGFLRGSFIMGNKESVGSCILQSSTTLFLEVPWKEDICWGFKKGDLFPVTYLRSSYRYRRKYIKIVDLAKKYLCRVNVGKDCFICISMYLHYLHSVFSLDAAATATVHKHLPASLQVLMSGNGTDVWRTGCFFQPGVKML